MKPEMTEPIDLEVIAVQKSARAMSCFASYVMDLDESLTYVEAVILASKIVQGLPTLFDANPEAFDAIRAAIAEAEREA